MRLICEWCQKILGQIEPLDDKNDIGFICKRCFKKVYNAGTKREKVRALMLLSTKSFSYVNPMLKMLFLKKDYINDYELNSEKIDLIIQYVCEKGLNTLELNKMLEFSVNPTLQSISEKFNSLLEQFQEKIQSNKKLNHKGGM